MKILWLLVLKVLREQRMTLAFCFVLLGVFFTVGVYLFVTFGDMQTQALSKISPQLIASMFGGLLGTMTPLETWLITLFAHPLVWMLHSVLIVAVATRSLAGEIDRGTVDVLLAYPVARRQLVTATLIVLVACLMLFGLELWLCMKLGFRIAGLEVPESLPAFRWVSLNLFALFFAAGGIALALSSRLSNHGRAIGHVLGFLVVSFFINLIASLWKKVEVVDVVSIFHYFQSQPIVESGQPPVFDLVVLFSVGAIGITYAYLHFEARDIATV